MEKKKILTYEIMHMNKVAAAVSMNGKASIYHQDFMPYDLYLEEEDDNDIDVLVNNLDNFHHWCASRVLTLDRKYAKELLNSIGAVQATTDRHPENWGFLVDNRNNRYIALYPLMDFNQSFLSSDNMDGSSCQTVGRRGVTQREAAIEAVKCIGLRQIRNMDMTKFGDMQKEAEMFLRRLEELKRVWL